MAEAAVTTAIAAAAAAAVAATLTKNLFQCPVFLSVIVFISAIS
jgi:hypothetical protein